MSFKINVDLNIKTQHWSSISKHVDRKHENYSNQNINKALSQKNLNLTQANGSQLIEAHFQPFIDKHDKKIKDGKSRAKPYNSIDNYLKRRHATPERTWVIKFGSADSQKALLKGLKAKLGNPLNSNKFQVMIGKGIVTINAKAIENAKIKADNLGFTEYLRGFNARNGKYFRVAEAETNIDETSPHIHARIIPLAYSKSKRQGLTPSTSMSKALEQKYHDKNNRVAIHHLHQVEDSLLLKSMSKAYSKVFGLDIHFQLTRSHNGYHGLGEKQFETLKKHEDIKREAEQREAELQFQRLGRAVNSLSKQNHSLKSRLGKTKTKYRKAKYRKVEGHCNRLQLANKAWSQCYSQLNSKYQSIKSKVQSGTLSSRALYKLSNQSDSGVKAYYKKLINGFVKFKLNESKSEKKNNQEAQNS